MSTPQQLFRERARWLRRDLKNGSIKPSEVEEYIRADWDKDEPEFADAYGVTSFRVFRAGVLAALGDVAKLGRKKASAKVKPLRSSAMGSLKAPQSRFASFLRGLVGKKPKGCKCR